MNRLCSVTFKKKSITDKSSVVLKHDWKLFTLRFILTMLNCIASIKFSGNTDENSRICAIVHQELTLLCLNHWKTELTKIIYNAVNN